MTSVQADYFAYLFCVSISCVAIFVYLFLHIYIYIDLLRIYFGPLSILRIYSGGVRIFLGGVRIYFYVFPLRIYFYHQGKFRKVLNQDSDSVWEVDRNGAYNYITALLFW